MQRLCINKLDRACSLDLTFGYFHKNVFPVGFAMSDFHDLEVLSS